MVSRKRGTIIIIMKSLRCTIIFSSAVGKKKTGRKTVITKEEIEEGIKTIQRLSLTKLISQDERKLIKKFLDFVKAQVKSNIEDCFVY